MKKTRKNLSALTLGLVLPCLAASAAFADLPKTWPEFKTRYQEEAKTPEGALKMHLQAVFAYMNPDTRGEASKMLRYSMHLSGPVESSPSLTSFFVPRMKDPKEQHIFRSYCAGTSPENSYKVDLASCELNITGARDSEGYRKVGLQSTGADSERLIWMRQHDGLWYAENNTALYVQVRPPKEILDMAKNAHDPDFDGKTGDTAQPGEPLVIPEQPPAPPEPAPVVVEETPAPPVEPVQAEAPPMEEPPPAPPVEEPAPEKSGTKDWKQAQ